jgi:hypothetical protein
MPDTNSTAYYDTTHPTDIPGRSRFAMSKYSDPTEDGPPSETPKEVARAAIEDASTDKAAAAAAATGTDRIRPASQAPMPRAAAKADMHAHRFLLDSVVGPLRQDGTARTYNPAMLGLPMNDWEGRAGCEHSAAYKTVRADITITIHATLADLAEAGNGGTAAGPANTRKNILHENQILFSDLLPTVDARTEDGEELIGGQPLGKNALVILRCAEAHCSSDAPVDVGVNIPAFDRLYRENGKNYTCVIGRRDMPRLPVTLQASAPAAGTDQERHIIVTHMGADKEYLARDVKRVTHNKTPSIEFIKQHSGVPHPVAAFETTYDALSPHVFPAPRTPRLRTNQYMSEKKYNKLVKIMCDNAAKHSPVRCGTDTEPGSVAQFSLVDPDQLRVMRENMKKDELMLQKLTTEQIYTFVVELKGVKMWVANADALIRDKTANIRFKNMEAY